MRELETAFCSIVVVMTMVWASNAIASECVEDSDCEPGEYCLMAPCPAIACDPHDEDCDYECEPEGECADEGEWWGSQDCETDDDCSEGWVCETVGAVACTDMACPPDEECPEPPPCEEEEWTECVPDLTECVADSDCPEPFVCITVEYTECSGSATSPACPPGEDCPDPPEPEEPDCEEGEESFCAPPYIAPCEEDDDCGEGFTCEEVQECACSGGGAVGGGSSGSTGTDSGGDDDSGDGEGDDDGFDCDCEGIDEYYCQPEEIDCEEDPDCPEDWSCMSAPSPGAPCYYNEETDETFCEEEEDTPESICIPPDWGYWGAGGSSGYGEAAADASGVDDINWDVGEEQGSGSGVTRSSDDSSEAGDDTDCQQVHGVTGMGLLLVMLLGLAAVLRRTRVPVSSR